MATQFVGIQDDEDHDEDIDIDRAAILPDTPEQLQVKSMRQRGLLLVFVLFSCCFWEERDSQVKNGCCWPVTDQTFSAQLLRPGPRVGTFICIRIGPLAAKVSKL